MATPTNEARTSLHPAAFGRGRSLSRWISWLSGLAALIAVALFVAHRTEEEAFARLVVHARPAWLLLAAALQLGTYVADARIWQRSLSRANVSRPLRSYVGLGLAKLLMDQVVPSGGLSGTFLIVWALDRRGVPRGASMAAVVVDLVSYYAAFVLALGVALGVVWMRGDLLLYFALPVALFALLAAAIPTTVLLVSRGRALPRWMARFPVVRPALGALAEATPRIAHDVSLIARCTGLQLAIMLLDAATLWVMLWALGVWVHPAPVFASFMLSTLARTLGPIPGGLGVFEAASVATLSLMGVSVAAGLAATLLFRGFSFWLPLVPGLVFARRESRR
ncbi:MAG: lysylphosphatidylglycerol synthase transmembrane domain-containing protein [Polyangiales bacterium]